MAQVEPVEPFHGTEQNLRFSLTMVWDTGTLAWVKGTQGAGGGGGDASAANQVTIIGHVDGIETLLSSIDGNLPSPGQAAMAASVPVAIASDQTSIPVAGNVAHDAVDSGNPVKLGAIAVAHGSAPSPVAAADRTNLLANRHGILFSLGGHPNVVTRRDNYTTAQTDTAIVSVSTGSKIVVLRQSVLASNANSVDVAVRIGFGTSSTPTGAGVVLAHPGVAKGSGVVEGNGGAILGIGADDEDLRITSGVPTGGSIDVVTTYFVIES